MIATTDDVMKMKEDDMTPMQLLEKKAHIQVAERIGWMKDAHRLPEFERYPPQPGTGD